MSCWRSSSIRSPDRTIPWSSAIRTRTGSACARGCVVIIHYLYRHEEPNPCADLRPGLDLQVAVHEQGALAHPGEAEAAGRLIEREPAPVVGDDELDDPVVACQVDVQPVGPR